MIGDRVEKMSARRVATRRALLAGAAGVVQRR